MRGETRKRDLAKGENVTFRALTDRSIHPMDTDDRERYQRQRENDIT